MENFINKDNHEFQHSHMTRETKQEMLNSTVKHKSERVQYNIPTETPSPQFLTQDNQSQEGGVTDQNPNSSKK